MRTMLTVDEADTILQESARKFAEAMGTRECELARAAGRMLRETIVADRDLPPFDRVMMDGIVVTWDDVLSGRTTFEVRGCLPAGQDRAGFMDLLDSPGGAIEIMTGAPLPGTAARLAVVPVEDIRIEPAGETRPLPEAGARASRTPGGADGQGKTVTLIRMPEGRGRFVHPRGSDCRAGQPLLRPGRRLSSLDVAVAASCGRPTLAVARRPTVAILATGDELVDVTSEPAAHQIRVSNALMLAAALGPCAEATPCDGSAFGQNGGSAFSQNGGSAFGENGGSGLSVMRVGDDERLLYESARAALASFDVLVLSGGVSMGRFDAVPRILERLGVQCHFHKIRQRPGKPLWFGTRPPGETAPRAVFGLPGNPASALLCAFRYVVPWLSHLEDAAGPRPLRPRCLLAGDRPTPSDLTQFLPVRLVARERGTSRQDPDVLRAERVLTNGSGDFAGLIDCDGFLEWPADEGGAGAGRERVAEPLPLILFRPVQPGQLDGGRGLA